MYGVDECNFRELLFQRGRKAGLSACLELGSFASVLRAPTPAACHRELLANREVIVIDDLRELDPTVRQLPVVEPARGRCAGLQVAPPRSGAILSDALRCAAGITRAKSVKLSPGISDTS